MSDITRVKVEKLRELTDCGLLDCKNALIAAKGDFEGAMNLLKNPMTDLEMQYNISKLFDMLNNICAAINAIDDRLIAIEKKVK